MTWTFATTSGSADQAHLVREFREFGAEPPTHFFSPEWYATTELTRATGPDAGDARSIQDPSRNNPQ